MSGLNSLLQQIANPGSGTLQGVPGLGSVDLNPIENVPSGLGAIDSFRQGRADSAARDKAAAEEGRAQAQEGRAAAESESQLSIDEANTRGEQIENFNEADKARLQALGSVALQIKDLSDDKKLRVVEDAIPRFNKAGIVSSDLEEFKETIASGDREEIDEDIANAIAAAKASGLGDDKLQRLAFEEVEGGGVAAIKGFKSGEVESELITEVGGRKLGAETPAKKRLEEFKDFQQRERFKTKESARKVFDDAIAGGEAVDLATARSGIFAAAEALESAQALEALLESGIGTGGIKGTLINLGERWLNIRAPDKAEAERLMKEQALALLANFPGQISEGERAFVVDMETNFGISREGNLRLVKRGIELQKSRLERGQAATEGREAFDAFTQKTLNQALGNVTVKNVVDQFGETEIARVAKQNNMTRDEAIEALREELDAEAAQ